MHVWLYTNGTRVDRDILLRLRDAGLDEIRFDIGATGYRLDKLRLAVGHIPTVTVEIPAIAEEKALMQAKMVEMAEAGVNYLNLHQLRLTPYNFERLAPRGYTRITSYNVCYTKLLRASPPSYRGDIMTLLFTLVGVVLGAFLYSSHNRFLLGAVVGGLLALLWLRMQRMQARMGDLESRLTQALQTKEAVKPAPAPRSAVPPQETPAPAEDFLFEIEPQETLPPRQAPARPAASARPTPPVPRPAVPRPMPKPPQKPAHQIELWNIIVSYFTGGT